MTDTVEQLTSGPGLPPLGELIVPDTPPANGPVTEARSIDGSDILDNHLGHDRQVVEILASDKAFETARCGVWTMT
jgi:hypothetical protein